MRYSAGGASAGGCGGGRLRGRGHHFPVHGGQRPEGDRNRNRAAGGGSRNAVANAEFHLGAVEDVLPKLVEQGLRPDVVLLDPPRKGVEQPVIDAVLRTRPRRVVYVSCHVPTQARDVKLLRQGGYRLEACQPVDMFCYAGGVENVVSLIWDEPHD